MSRILFLLITSLSTSIVANATEYDCDKKYCKEMRSCDEAYYQLQVCDFDQLDRDGDGVPCESICGKGGNKQSKKSKQEIKQLLTEQEKENNNQENEMDTNKK